MFPTTRLWRACQRVPSAITVPQNKTLTLESAIFFNALKGQVNSFNIVLLSGAISFVFYKLNRRRTATVVGLLCFFFFVLFSTRYLPGHLVRNLESTYPPFRSALYHKKHGPLYIHVLAGGYTLDGRLSPLSQISEPSLARLTEGVRLCHLYDSSLLVVSGNVASGNESVASVMRKAAISLGVEAWRIRMLEGPATTFEEARAFAERYGPNASVIVVTDAVHMPRAVAFFKVNGISPYPAPTNYLIKENENDQTFKWIPSAKNFLLMDRVMREYLGSVKARLMEG